MQPEPSEEAPASVPRYLNHTFCSKCSGSSQHAEIERVANSFRSCNFLSLNALPTTIKPGGIEESRRKRISSGRSSKPEHIHRMRVNKDYFTPITYSRDEYMKVAADEKMERHYKQLTSLSFSRKPFTYATSRIRLKNEDIFGDEKYKFPVLGPGAGVTELETVVRTDFTDATKMLHGAFFVPARVQQEFPRDELGLWCKEIYTRLSEDWSHLRFWIRCIGDDELIISFDMEDKMTEEELASTIEQPDVDGECARIQDICKREGICDMSCSLLVNSLAKYMNTMAQHGVANHRRLRKRGDRWKIFEREKQKGKGYCKRVLVFAFYTPWYMGATRNIHKNVSMTERLETRKVILQTRGSSSPQDFSDGIVLSKPNRIASAPQRLSGFFSGSRGTSNNAPHFGTSTTSSNSPRSE